MIEPVWLFRQDWSSQPQPPMCRSGATAFVRLDTGRFPSAARRELKPQSRREMAYPWLREGGEASKTMQGIPALVRRRAAVRPESPAPMMRMGWWSAIVGVLGL